MIVLLVLVVCGGGFNGLIEGLGVDECSFGLVDVLVMMIEYVFVVCGYCVIFYEEVWGMIEFEFVEIGKVCYVMCEMFNGGVIFVVVGFFFVCCVEDDCYFDMVDLLF